MNLEINSVTALIDSKGFLTYQTELSLCSGIICCIIY